jgi:hypothetical protein
LVPAFGGSNPSTPAKEITMDLIVALFAIVGACFIGATIVAGIFKVCAIWKDWNRWRVNTAYDIDRLKEQQELQQKNYYELQDSVHNLVELTRKKNDPT